MTIYTSYFANVVNIPEDYPLYNIAQQMPTWIFRDVKQLNEVKPPWKLIKAIKSNKISEQEYIFVYSTYVEPYLNKVAHTMPPNAVLLCWEAPPLFCHRHILAKLLRDRMHIDVLEYLN